MGQSANGNSYCWWCRPGVSAFHLHFEPSPCPNAFKTSRGLPKILTSSFRIKSGPQQKRIGRYARGIVSGGTLFEEWVYYVWPVDGYDLETSFPFWKNSATVLVTSRSCCTSRRPRDTATHPAEEASDRMRSLQVQPRNWRPGQGGSRCSVVNFDLCELFD
jgi:hypothetical protein